MKRVFSTIWLVILLIVISFPVSANFLNGRIQVEKMPLSNSKLILEFGEDSIKTITNNKGEFVFNLDNFTKIPKSGDSVNLIYCVDSSLCSESSNKLEIDSDENSSIGIFAARCADFIISSIYYKALTNSDPSHYQRYYELREDDSLIVDKIVIQNVGDCYSEPFSIKINGRYNDVSLQDVFGLASVKIPSLRKGENYSFELSNYDDALPITLGFNIKKYIYKDSKGNAGISLFSLKLNEKGKLKLNGVVENKNSLKNNNILVYIKDYEEGITETFKIRDKTELENINILNTILDETKQNSVSSTKTTILTTAAYILITIIIAIFTVVYQNKGNKELGKKIEKSIRNIKKKVVVKKEE